MRFVDDLRTVKQQIMGFKQGLFWCKRQFRRFKQVM